MSFERQDLDEYAVLWPFARYDSYGNPTVGSPVEIRCSWEWRRHEVTDSEGNSIMVDAAVFVDRDIAIGSRMWLGRLADVAQATTNVADVRWFDKQPSMRKGVHVREVKLIRSASSGS